MKIFDRVRGWAFRSDDEKVSIDRRAFLRGMAVTSAGLLVPGATVFGAGRVVAAEPLWHFVGADEGEVPVWTDDDGNEYTFRERVPEGGSPVRTPGKVVVVGIDPKARTAGFSVFEFEGVGMYNPCGLTKLTVTR